MTDTEKLLPWWDQAIRAHADRYGPSGGAWNISMVLDCLHHASPQPPAPQPHGKGGTAPAPTTPQDFFSPEEMQGDASALVRDLATGGYHSYHNAMRVLNAYHEWAQAIHARQPGRPWRKVMDFHPQAKPSRESIIERFRQLSSFRHAELFDELTRARDEALLKPQWFYAEGYDQDGCCDSPEQVLEYLNLKPGDNVVQVDCAGPLPSLWYIVHVRTDDEMDALETDDREVFTQYPSEEAARAALATEKQP